MNAVKHLFEALTYTCKFAILHTRGFIMQTLKARLDYGFALKRANFYLQMHTSQLTHCNDGMPQLCHCNIMFSPPSLWGMFGVNDEAILNLISL